MGKLEILAEALCKEKDGNVCTRIIAVRSVLLGNSTASTAATVNATQRTIQLWLVRFNEDGIKGLYPATGRGRKPKASYAWVSKLAIRLCNKGMLTPKKLRRWVRSRIGLSYSVGNIRRILRELGFSRKTSVVKLGDAADAKKVTYWQADTKRAIAGAKRAGFMIVVQDESIFIRVGGDGAKLWSPIAQRVRVERSGRRDKVVVCGSIADDGTRLMRTYDRFNGANFVRYLELARQKWGKVLMIMDNASQHKTKKVRRYLEQNPDVRILYLPVARPELSAIEEIWRQAKYRLITSESYRTLDDLRRAVSEHFRTCSINVDIYTYLARSV